MLCSNEQKFFFFILERVNDLIIQCHKLRERRKMIFFAFFLQSKNQSLFVLFLLKNFFLENSQKTLKIERA